MMLILDKCINGLNLEKKIYSQRLQLTPLAIWCFCVLATFLREAILVTWLIKTFSLVLSNSLETEKNSTINVQWISSVTLTNGMWEVVEFWKLEVIWAALQNFNLLLC